MKNIINRGINSNMLKTIAIIAMVIDHIGFYFSSVLLIPIYTICRYVGRMAMPIFVYLLVQGFFHTKDFKKYVSRLALLAIITQLLITILMFINKKYVPNYISATHVYSTINILFSFVIILIILKILHKDIIIKKWDYNKNLSLKIILVFAIFITYMFIPFDYGVYILILGIFMYYIEKLNIRMYIEKSNNNMTIKNAILSAISESKLRMLYLSLILFSLLVLTFYFELYWSVLLCIIPIALYNGQRGRANMKYIYYVIFPLQHILLYLLAMITTLT